MDTKSTRFKYSNITKAICLLLAALLFSLGTWCAVELGVGSWVFGTREYFANSAGARTADYTRSQAFEEVLTSDMAKLSSLAEKNEKAYAKALAKAQEETVESVVKQYMSRQEYLKQRGSDPKEEYFERDPVVRLSTGMEETVSLTYDHMALPEEAIREELNRQYDDWEETMQLSYAAEFEDARDGLSVNDTLKFYVRSADGTVYTNLKAKPSAEALETHQIYGITDAKQNVLEGAGFLLDSPDYSPADVPDKAGIYFYLDDAFLLKDQFPAKGDLYRIVFEDQDEYVATKQLFDAMKDRPAGWILAIMLFSYLAGLALLLWFLHLVGHVNSDPVAADGSPEPVKYAKDGSRLTTAAIDKLPGDVHFLLSGTLFGLCLGLPLAFLSESFHNYSLLRWYPLAGALVALVCVLILAEWLASVCRTVKSGRGFWKHTLIGRFAVWFGGVLKRLWRSCKEALGFLEYTPKKLPKQAGIMALAYVAVNVLLANLMHIPNLGWAGFLLLLVFNVLVFARLVKYLRGLDDIIEASGTETPVDLPEDSPVALKELAGNLEVSQERIREAVDKAVQEELTRTELITNVTHDLKTPLTSLISYSDLLSRKAGQGQLGDEESRNYVGVIHDQSEKLKHLIDDLLEASKVSTGNVELHNSTLNLTELAAQAIAEFAPEMDANGNNVVFVDGGGGVAAAEHTVYADGSMTYRILSNLLSNAKKYSAPGTRVYATVSDGPNDTTVFELKNISAAPLNISAEELMARFVRGDRSRGETEGNGLGLSIARDLAVLMGGTLDLAIDGDLFKAIVTLPKQEN